ncbi:GNAT family N-acetyltransferase [Sphingomonas canadensis]|uniref:GNAT family N-acetyltransferase n=1 Tax=Sphingomonas canadensis TaxID=1219257 RepID=A0ABW3H9M4_9SPHN|nr:GNAT family N-acetyltransferase [Sphingomonas canadensis]MCW3838012.1 GNAT family N-acetyltransferase [Sphingomonas canadensis]
MIVTERLVLRLPEPRDHPALLGMWADPEVMAELGPVKDEAAGMAVLAKHDAYRHEGLGFWTVERRADGAVIGFCGLKRGDADNPIAGEVEAGWIVDRPYWRMGYAYEAMVASLAWGWANLDAPRIVAITAAINRKSQALMEKLGMVRLADGDYLHPRFPDDSPLRPTVTYAIARPA